MSSPPPTTLSPRLPNSVPAMSKEQTDPVMKRNAGVPPRPSRTPARMIPPHGDHTDELHRASRRPAHRRHPLMARDNGREQPSARPQMASLGNGRMTSFDLADWVRQSRASQGLPAKVAD